LGGGVVEILWGYLWQNHFIFLIELFLGDFGERGCRNIMEYIRQDNWGNDFLPLFSIFVFGIW